MQRIAVLDSCDVKALSERVKCALIRFEGNSGLVLMPMKSFGKGEEKKGWEQLKRWVSAASFGAIILDGFAAAYENMDSSEVLSWFDGHLEEPDCPLLILSGGAPEGVEAPSFSTTEELIERFLS